MAKVTKIENGNIVLDNGITLGRIQHPSFFKTGAHGIIMPAYKAGDDIDIPAEAIMTSSSGRSYIRVDKNAEQLAKEIASLEVSLKKAQISKEQAIMKKTLE